MLEKKAIILDLEYRDNYTFYLHRRSYYVHSLPVVSTMKCYEDGSNIELADLYRLSSKKKIVCVAHVDMSRNEIHFNGYIVPVNKVHMDEFLKVPDDIIIS